MSHHQKGGCRSRLAGGGLFQRGPGRMRGPGRDLVVWHWLPAHATPGFTLCQSQKPADRERHLRFGTYGVVDSGFTPVWQWALHCPVCVYLSLCYSGGEVSTGSLTHLFRSGMSGLLAVTPFSPESDCDHSSPGFCLQIPSCIPSLGWRARHFPFPALAASHPSHLGWGVAG